MPGNILSPVGPSPLYVQQGDCLILDVTAQQPTASIYKVGYRMIRVADGQPFVGEFLTAAAVNAGPTYTYQALPEGWLLGVTITQEFVGASVPTLAGQAGFNLVQLYVGQANTGIGSLGIETDSTIGGGMLLISASPPAFQTLCWPSSGTRLGTDGAGTNNTLTKANPAAGVNFSFSFNAVLRTQVFNVRFRLVTDANAANRQVGITFTDANANIFSSSFIQATQAASLTVDYNFAVGVGPSFPGAATLIAIPTGDDVQGALPPVCISDTTVLASVVKNIQVGDQISAITIRCQTWNEQD